MSMELQMFKNTWFIILWRLNKHWRQVHMQKVNLLYCFREIYELGGIQAFQKSWDSKKQMHILVTDAVFHVKPFLWTSQNSHTVPRGPVLHLD